MPPPPPPEGQPAKRDGRINAAINHLVPMGYAARDVRSAVEELLEVHGGAAGWPFLEEGSYQVVQDFLLEEEEEEVKKLLLLDAELEPQQLETAGSNQVSPEHGMQISQAYNEPPPETSAVLDKSKLLASPNKSPVHKAVLPFPTATNTARLRPPTHGWISTESESESESDDGEILSAEPNPAETLLSKRKRPSRSHEHSKW